MKLHSWIIFIIFVFIFGWCVIVNNRYLELEYKYNELTNSKSEILDSLIIENNKSAKIIESLKDSLTVLEKELVDISNKTIEVEDKTFVVSSSFSESVILLNNNLKCVEL